MTESVRAASEPEMTRRIQLFMRRPWLDDLPEPPPLPLGYIVRAYEPDDLSTLATLLTRAFGDLWDEGQGRRRLVEAPDGEATQVIAHHDRRAAPGAARA